MVNAVVGPPQVDALVMFKSSGVPIVPPMVDDPLMTVLVNATEMFGSTWQDVIARHGQRRGCAHFRDNGPSLGINAFVEIEIDAAKRRDHLLQQGT